MIQKAHFPKFRTSELLQFISDALTVCDNSHSARLQIADKVAEVLTANKALDATFKTDQASALSAEILMLDQRRDACLTGIRLNADSWSYHYDPAKAKIGNLVRKSIDKYGSGLTILNFQAETSTISSILESWQNDQALVEAIDGLQLSAWVAELKLTNELFNKTYLARVEEKSKTIHTHSSVELRKVVVDSYRELCKNIEARATLSAGTYDALINQLNVLTTKYNLLVDSRTSTKQTSEAVV